MSQELIIDSENVQINFSKIEPDKDFLPISNLTDIEGTPHLCLQVSSKLYLFVVVKYILSTNQ